MARNSPETIPDKLQPHNIEAEEAVLGALLIDPDAILRVATFLDPVDFFVERHGWVYESIRELHERREAVDLVTLSDELERRGQLSDIGGPAYLSSLINATPTSIHVEFYGRIVERTSLLRKLIDAAGQIARLAYDESQDAAEVVDRAEEIIFNVSSRKSDHDLRPIRQVMDKFYDRIEYLHQHRGEIVGIPSGLADLDKLLGGLQRSDMLVLAGRPGMGKCVSADTRLVDPETGGLYSIETLVQRRRANLLTLDQAYKLGPAQASHFVDDGHKPLYRVRTALGREIKVTLTHPFLTLTGWQPLGDLSVGDAVAVPRQIPVFGSLGAPDYKVKVLAYLLADGCLTGSSPQFINSNPRLREDFIDSALNFPGTKSRLESSQGQRTPSVYINGHKDFIASGRLEFAQRLKQKMEIRSLSTANVAQSLQVSPSLVTQWRSGRCVPNAHTSDTLCKTLDLSPDELARDGLPAISRNSPNSLTVWLKTQDVWNKSAAQKEIPDWIYRLTRPKLALFLNRLFACDGSIYIQLGKQGAISYSTVSKSLAHSVQHLLLRFGIIAKLRHRRIKYRDQRRTAYELRVMGVENLKLFVDEIGIFGKEEAVEKVRQYIEQTSANTNIDTTPLEVWDQIKQAKGDARTWRSLYDEMGLPSNANIHVGQRAPSRARLLAIGQALRSQNLVNLTQSDIYWDKITDIDYLGEHQVYDLTVPTTHNFVADDMIVHNTSLGLSIALQAARRWQKRIAIFSLEMSDEQLVQRLVSAETGIDSQRLRLGDIKQDEWPTFIQATNLLASAPIFIDDTPAISALELRSKARRLHAEHGLDLLIVDYLQLMRGDFRSENRQQEISFISRSIKSLARELNIPILALSQLSRQVESRHDKRPMLSDLRESGCLTGDSLIYLPGLGQYIPIRDLVGKTDFQVLAVNRMSWKLESATVTNAFSTGVKPVYRLTTQLGRTIRATANHKFLTIKGWKRLDEIDSDERIALPRRLESPSNPTMSNEELALLGHLIGDGCTLPRHSIQYTTRERDLADTVVKLTINCFGDQIKPRINEERTWYQVYLSAAQHLTHNTRNPVAKWLDDLGAFGFRSHEKRVPEKVFVQPINGIAIFLRHLWATDGCIHLGKGQRRIAQVYYATSSEGLARDVQSLLLRLGINARLVQRSQNGKGRDQFHVIVSGKFELEQFIRLVGAVGSYKTEHLEAIQQHLENRPANTNRDVIPNDVWQMYAVPAMQNQGLTTRQLHAGLGNAYCGTGLYKQNISRQRAAKLAEVVHSDEIADLAESDIYWDKIASIEADGCEEVFDLTVPGPHNFVANEIVVHNSIEQDADIVLFIYRDDVYNPDTEFPNIAEIIVSKHRSGPTGIFSVYFKKQLAQFVDLEVRTQPLDFE